MKHDFKQKQVEKIYELIEYIHKCKSDNSGCKIESLCFYKDDKNNFYSSYYFHGSQGGQPHSAVEYIMIDKDGVKTDLRHTYSSVYAIEQKFSKLEKITF